MSATILENPSAANTIELSERHKAQDPNVYDGKDPERESRYQGSPHRIDDSERSEDHENAVGDESVQLTTRTVFKLCSSILSFFVAGVNDGSLGALIPYIIIQYHVTTSRVSIVFVTAFLGWLTTAVINPYVTSVLGRGGALVLGAGLQLLGQCLRFWIPPFGLFCVTFYIVALGVAFQDSHANTFVSTVKSAHRWLGVVHASYGFGCLVGPLVATAIASSGPNRWQLFYFCLVGFSTLNLGGVIFAFWAEVLKLGVTDENQEQGLSERRKSAVGDLKTAMKLKSVWLLAIFFFFFLSVAITAGGWIVEYLTTARGAPLSKVGYVPTGFYGGLAFGRLLLAEPTYRYGERRMLFIYSVICLVLQLIFWLVKNIYVDAVAVSIMGFALGPFFPTGVSTGTRLFPKHLHASALGLVFVIGQAGGTIFPALVGLIATHAGVGVLQPILVALIVAMAISWALVPKADKPKD